jgi:hypothetical protein
VRFHVSPFAGLAEIERMNDPIDIAKSIRRIGMVQSCDKGEASAGCYTCIRLWFMLAEAKSGVRSF